MKSATHWTRSSRDCGFIAWPEPDCTLALWDRAMGKKITTLYEPRPTNRMVSYQMLPCQLPVAAFSPDCQFLATRRCREAIVLWNLQSRPRQVSKIGRLPDSGGHKLIGVEFSSDSRLLVAVAMNHLGKRGRENTITVWEVAKRRKMLHVRSGRNRKFDQVGLSPNMKMLVAGEGPRNPTTDRIRLWDIERGKELVSLKGGSASFSPDSRFLYVNGSDRMQWDIKAGKMRVLKTAIDRVKPKSR